MEGKRKLKGWRMGLAIGGLVIVALLILTAIGWSKRKEPKSSQYGEVLKQQTSGYRTTSGKDTGSPEETESRLASGAVRTEGTKTQLQQVPKVESKTIKTGTVSLEIKKGSFEDNYGKVQLIAEGAGGLIADSRANSSNGKIAGGTITIRIPNETFGKAMEQLRTLGKVTGISEQAQDVTEEYVDLESRIRNLRSQESVYLDLMSRANTVEETISVQRELSVLQGQIEELTGRRNYLDNHITYSTIQVTLTEPGAGAVAGGDGWGFLEALKDAAHGLVYGLNSVIRFFGGALVYMVIVAALAFAVYALIKRKPHEKPA